jgi:hypothetical protein
MCTMARWCPLMSRSFAPRTKADQCCSGLGGPCVDTDLTGRAPPHPQTLHMLLYPYPSWQSIKRLYLSCTIPVSAWSLSEMRWEEGRGSIHSTWLWPLGLGERAWGRSGLRSQNGSEDTVPVCSRLYVVSQRARRDSHPFIHLFMYLSDIECL